MFAEDLRRLRSALVLAQTARDDLAPTDYRYGGEAYRLLGEAKAEIERAIGRMEVEERRNPTGRDDDKLVGPLLEGEPEVPEDHFRDDPRAPDGEHCGDEDCSYCNWCYGKEGEVEAEPEDRLESLLNDLRMESR